MERKQELKQELKQSRQAGGATGAAAAPTVSPPAPRPAVTPAPEKKAAKIPNPAASPAPASKRPPPTSSPDDRPSRKARRKERSKLLKAKKKAGRKRGQDSDDGSDDARPLPPRNAAAAPRGGLPQSVAAPLAATLKTRHWVEGEGPAGGRLGAVFERQLAAAKARASGVTAEDRSAAIEAYRAAKGGNVGGATRTSLKALVAAGAARGVSAADGKRG